VTTRQFIAMIGEAETGGLAHTQERQRAIGDGGLAGGFYQQHWQWRVDYWRPWMWDVLQYFDADAIGHFVARRHGMTALQLAETYNCGRISVDPAYRSRCVAGLSAMGLDAAELGKPLSDS